jgi:protein-tyrosine phosphatase
MSAGEYGFLFSIHDFAEVPGFGASGHRPASEKMREIIPARLWLGNAADAREVSRLADAGIVAVIDLAVEHVAPALSRSMLYFRVPLMDGEQGSRTVLRIAVEALVSLLEAELPTLVCCSAGMSRSPAVAAAALSIVHGGSPDERLRQIVAGHPHDVSAQLWRDVREVCREMGC